MSIATDNRVAELERWRETAEAKRAEFEAALAQFRAKLEEIARAKESDRGKPR